jgi:hypothetical protein
LVLLLINKNKIDSHCSAITIKEANIFAIVNSYGINGEIASTGTKTLFQENVTIMEAIANVGGYTITRCSAVTIIRKTATESKCMILYGY